MPETHTHTPFETSPLPVEDSSDSDSDSSSDSSSSSDSFELGSGDLHLDIARLKAQCHAWQEETRQLRLQSHRITIYTQCMHAEADILRAMLDASDSDDDAEPEPEPEDLGWQERMRAAAGRAWSASRRRPERRPQTLSPARVASTSNPPPDTNTDANPGTHQCENLLRSKNKAALRELATALRLSYTKKTRVAELRTLISQCFLEIEAFLRTQHPEFGR